MAKGSEVSSVGSWAYSKWVANGDVGPHIGLSYLQAASIPVWNLADEALCAQASKAHYAVVKEARIPVPALLSWLKRFNAIAFRVRP